VIGRFFKGILLLLALSVQQAAEAAPDSCYAVTGLHVTEITAFSATLAWDASSGATGYLYAITKSSVPPGKYGAFTKETTHTDDGLKANATYYAHVRSSCGAKRSSWRTVQFNTPAPDAHRIAGDSSFAIQVYPSQADLSVTIKVKGSEEGFAAVRLFDALGTSIKEYPLLGDRLHIEVASLPLGIYFLRYTDNQGRLEMLRFTRF
jgi:hypothetical protein